MDDKMLERFEGEIVNIIYRNEDNGYTVAEFESDKDCFVAVGYSLYHEVFFTFPKAHILPGTFQ